MRSVARSFTQRFFFDARRNLSSRPSPTDKYLFDLNGYLIIRNVFSDVEISEANKAIDSHIPALHERTGKLKLFDAYGVKGTALSGTRLMRNT